MPQSTIYPIRFGLQVPRGEQVQAVEVLSEGGLDLTQSVIGIRPGCASELTNYEVALTGGYRRIDGFFQYNSSSIPGTGPIIGVAVYYPGFIIAARQQTDTTYAVFSSSGSTWTNISSAITLTYSSSLTDVRNYSYNWTGTHRLVFTDGVNPAYRWDGTTMTSLNGAGSAADPQIACTFNGYLFVSGYSSNYGAVKISAPLNETDWATVDGAAEVVIGDAVVAMRIWRDQLIIFCRRSIYKITGNSTSAISSTPFQVQPVTTKVGCLEGRTVQECDGDLVFLSQDGIRTISGTFNIGDTEIASISRPIQNLIADINSIQTPLHSLVVQKKTQYRLFQNNALVGATNNTTGIIGSIRRFRDGHEAWEWGQLSGFNVNCCTSGYMIDGKEYVISGGNDGVVYQQEVGNTLNGANMESTYTTVPFDLGDRGVRKAIYRVTIYIAFEGAAPNLTLEVIYDYDGENIIQPAAYTISSNSAAMYDDPTSIYGTTIYAEAGAPIIRQLVQGSGFIAELKLSSVLGNSASYTIQGFYIEYFPCGRR